MCIGWNNSCWPDSQNSDFNHIKQKIQSLELIYTKNVQWFLFHFRSMIKCQANEDESVQSKVVKIFNTPTNIWVFSDIQKMQYGKLNSLVDGILKEFFIFFHWCIFLLNSGNANDSIRMSHFMLRVQISSSSSCAIQLHLLILFMCLFHCCHSFLSLCMCYCSVPLLFIAIPHSFGRFVSLTRI